jgi:hypothetical protein
MSHRHEQQQQQQQQQQKVVTNISDRSVASIFNPERSSSKALVTTHMTHGITTQKNTTNKLNTI